VPCSRDARIINTIPWISMHPTHVRVALGSLLAVALLLPVVVTAQQARPAGQADRAAVQKIVDGWPNRPKLGAMQMLDKYGPPQEATSEKLVWHNQGPYTRINVTKAEHHHDFPKPHMDYMEHTIAYQVPPEKAEALTRYDGSLTFDRTRGELSARCDLEGHNILTLNLAHDIVMGKMDADAARKAFGENVVDDATGKYPPYTTALRFEPKMQGAMFADVPVIPGSPKRAVGNADAKGDAEVLGLVGAVNDNEIVAAMEAGKKKLSQPVADYAKMLHMDHGMNLEKTLMLGQKIDVTPMETAEVDKLRVKGAGELAMLVPLTGDTFSAAYLAAMIKGHTEVLDMIDNQLLKRAAHEAVKAHLTDTRASVAKHLAAAKQLRAGPTR
jgi:predicted outer membrane protein